MAAATRFLMPVIKPVLMYHFSLILPVYAPEPVPLFFAELLLRTEAWMCVFTLIMMRLLRIVKSRKAAHGLQTLQLLYLLLRRMELYMLKRVIFIQKGLLTEM